MEDVEVVNIDLKKRLKLLLATDLKRPKIL